MRADPASPTGTFVTGLLNPSSPVPLAVKGKVPRRYAVYRNNVTVSLIRAMESNFPVVRRLLGDEYFAGLARNFVQQHPPQSPLMFHYGAAFSDYLTAEEDLRDYPYLGDVAILEQQMRHAYHAADAPLLSAAALTEVAEDDLMFAAFVLHPAMAIVSSDFAIHTIAMAHRDAEVEPVVDVGRAESVLIVRPLHDVHLHLVNGSQAVFLRSLAAGDRLGVAAEHAYEADDTFDLAQAIGLTLLPGVFQSINIKTE